jgi:hypothetical protein
MFFPRSQLDLRSDSNDTESAFQDSIGRFLLKFGKPNVFVFSRPLPSLQIEFSTGTNDTKGAFQVSIGRFSSKFFGKRRKRRRALKAFLRKVRSKIGLCEDTGVFVKIIHQIVSQFGDDYFADPSRGTVAGPDTYCPSQFTQLILPFNSDLNRVINSRLHTFSFSYSIWISTLSSNQQATGLHPILFRRCFALFDLFCFPPHIQLSHRRLEPKYSNLIPQNLSGSTTILSISHSQNPTHFQKKLGRSSWLYTPLSNSLTHSLWRS